MSERVLRGTSAAPGIDSGTVFRFVRRQPMTLADNDSTFNADQEIKQLMTAVERVRSGIETARRITAERVGEAEAALFDAHALMLDDPAFIGEALRRIREQGEPAARAIEQTANSIWEMFESINDPYLRERAADVRDVANQIIVALREQQAVGQIDLPERAIVVADELFPSDTFRFDVRRLAGLVTQRGSPTAHVAILARALKIPTIVALEDALGNTSDGDIAVIDGDAGTLVVLPSPGTMAELRRRMRELEMSRERQAGLRNVSATTTDGVDIALLANIGTEAEARAALEQGAEGIGLFRTEFVFQDRPAPPDEEEQYAMYLRVVEITGDKPVVIRTLDAGGDKPVAGLTDLPAVAELNPFLGRRGLRLSLEHPDLFRIQLRAILRAAASGNVWMMFPMVTTLWELRDARRLVIDVAEELRRERVDHRADLPVGIMVEVPAAAINADILIRDADFFSIGTNDLAQYTLAVDRTNPDLASRYNPLDPAVLTLIEMAARAANRHGKHVAVCGELAGDPHAVPILVGLGIRELSMSGSSIPGAKEVIRSLNASEASEAAKRLMQGIDSPGSIEPL